MVNFLRATVAQLFPAKDARLFGCPACGTSLAYGASRCGHCNEEAPVYNQRRFWFLFWLCAALSLAGIIWSMTVM